MAFPNIFSTNGSDAVIERLNNLTEKNNPKWGKMDAAQMLVHCNVSYEMVHENIHPKPNFLMKFFLKSIIKNIVVTEKPFKKNAQSAPAFIIKSSKNFEVEKIRLINYINKTQQLGAAHFDNKESASFGNLSVSEWNNLFYKHLDHHLTQFGV